MASLFWDKQLSDTTLNSRLLTLIDAYMFDITFSSRLYPLSFTGRNLLASIYQTCRNHCLFINHTNNTQNTSESPQNIKWFMTKLYYWPLSKHVARHGTFYDDVYQCYFKIWAHAKSRFIILFLNQVGFEALKWINVVADVRDPNGMLNPQFGCCQINVNFRIMWTQLITKISNIYSSWFIKCFCFFAWKMEQNIDYSEKSGSFRISCSEMLFQTWPQGLEGNTLEGHVEINSHWMPAPNSCECRN